MERLIADFSFPLFFFFQFYGAVYEIFVSGDWLGPHF